MVLKDITVSVFRELSNDSELLDLLEVQSTLMKDIRSQILNDHYPNIPIDNTLSRICVYEKSSSPIYDTITERGWVEIDIYVHKTKERIDRRSLLIAQRIIDLLDTKQRLKESKLPITAGISLNYYNRLPNMYTNEDWTKYGLVFYYDLIRL